MNPLTCFYHPDYEYPLPEKHPFPMQKFRLAAELIHACQAEHALHIQAPAIIDDASVELVHTPSYLKQLKAGSMTSNEEKRLGLPLRQNALYQRSRLEVSGTVAAMYAALQHGMAFNLAGGTHHAYADSGSGYCVLNDVAIAIQSLRQNPEFSDLQYMVIDTDAHQGNGTHHIFANDKNVFTYSIHVGKNFPSRKEAGSLDVPLPRWVNGGDYLQELKLTLPTAIQSFEPDIIFWITGADTHLCDRFGQMDLTTREMDQRNRQVAQWILNSSAATVVLFGGGYHTLPDETAILHTRAVLMAAATFYQHHHSALSQRCYDALNHPRLSVTEQKVHRVGQKVNHENLFNRE